MITVRWLAVRQLKAVGMVLVVLAVGQLLMGCGFAHRGADGGFTVFTVFKDLSVSGELAKADGTVVKGEVTSDVNADAIKAAAEGAAKGAKP